MLQRGKITELPAHQDMGYEVFSREALQQLMSIWGQFVLDGRYDLPLDKALNKTFPELRPMTVKDVLAMWQGL
jgi:hypothetical protein